MAMSAEHRSNLQPFTDNGDVSIWVNNSQWDEKPQTNKNNKILRKRIGAT